MSVQRGAPSPQGSAWTLALALVLPLVLAGCPPLGGGSGDPDPDVPAADGTSPDASCGAACAGAMVSVPAGRFTMGCDPARDTGCRSVELPPREVQVAAFRIDVHEVTVAAYRGCAAAGACTQASVGTGECNAELPDRPDHPVNCVTWEVARDFCAWAGKRLCTEAEWERAARGDDGRLQPWGDQAADCQRAVIFEGASGCGTGTTWPVGSRPLGAGPFGTLDQVGNVLEWVEDDWHDGFAGAPSVGTAWTDTPRNDDRVLRSSSFREGVGLPVRMSQRHADEFWANDTAYGARCCASGP